MWSVLLGLIILFILYMVYIRRERTSTTEYKGLPKAPDGDRWRIDHWRTSNGPAIKVRYQRFHWLFGWETLVTKTVIPNQYADTESKIIQQAHQIQWIISYYEE